jgi:bifunctional UDP-N-acetylglucosamine pyrophosphorylase/glucosamine-1-phosphate N-acetyltransferase
MMPSGRAARCVTVRPVVVASSDRQGAGPNLGGAPPVTDELSRTVVVLAAGEGKRMKSSRPKMLHSLLGRTLLGHVIAATESLHPTRTIVVVGHGAEEIVAHLAEIAPEAVSVLQETRRGTGHATRVALDAYGPGDGTVVVVNGDVPLLRPGTLRSLVEAHEVTGAAATVLTAEVDEPYGLGRVIRNPLTGAVDAIVEERDATSDQRAVTEINAGAYAFDAMLLSQALGKLSTANAQGEEYLTDVIGLLVDSDHSVLAYPTGDPTEVLGCNDRVELAGLSAILRDRINEDWMRAGVTIVDPRTTWIDVDVTLGPDTVVEPNTHLRGRTAVGEWAVVGPDTTLLDVMVGDGARVIRAHGEGVTIGPRAVIGPYSYLRPGTRLSERTKVGAFVEVKNSEVGAGTKIPHLSYVGDATIGEETNIGAANVVVNYDGVAKHHTVIGSHVRTGSDTMLVAPVTIGDGAYTAAGSVITKDVPPGALGVGRAQQRNVEGWVERRRAGTKAADAAATAQAAAGETDGESVSE